MPRQVYLLELENQSTNSETDHAVVIFSRLLPPAVVAQDAIYSGLCMEPSLMDQALPTIPIWQIASG